MAIGDDATTPKPGTVGLYHLAWVVPTIKDLRLSSRSYKKQAIYVVLAITAHPNHSTAKTQTVTNLKFSGAYRAKPGATLSIDRSRDR